MTGPFFCARSTAFGVFLGFWVGFFRFDNPPPVWSSSSSSVSAMQSGMSLEFAGAFPSSSSSSLEDGMLRLHHTRQQGSSELIFTMVYDPRHRPSVPGCLCMGIWVWGLRFHRATSGTWGVIAWCVVNINWQGLVAKGRQLTGDLAGRRDILRGLAVKTSQSLDSDLRQIEVRSLESGGKVEACGASTYFDNLERHRSEDAHRMGAKRRSLRTCLCLWVHEVFRGEHPRLIGTHLGSVGGHSEGEV